MKNIVLTIGGILFIFNTLFGCVVCDYEMFNFLLVDLSILLSVGLLYYLATVETLDNGFRIGLATFFIVTGLVRAALGVFLKDEFKDNFLLITFVGVLLVEVLFLVVVKVMNKK